jgi:8-oxo-dGDP phosphatase
MAQEQPAQPRRVGPWVVTGSREIHRTPWLRIREDDILWPDLKAAGWTVIEFRPAVGVVAITDDQQVHLVGQHRYAVDRFEWEIPEGLADDGEDLLAAAQRELREETGVMANRWTSLGAMHPHNSSCDCVYHLFFAQELHPGQAQPEETEILSHKLMPFSQAMEMVQDGRIMDVFTIVGIFRAWHYLNARAKA